MNTEAEKPKEERGKVCGVAIMEGRFKIYTVSMDDVLNYKFNQGKHKNITFPEGCDMPEHYIIHRVFFRYELDHWCVMVASPDFDIVSEGEIPPEIEGTMSGKMVAYERID